MFKRHRRLRSNKSIRNLVRETTLVKNDLIYPLFITEEENVKEEIENLPNVFRFSIDQLDNEIAELKELGIRAVLLFGVTTKKDNEASEAYNPEGVVQRAIKEIKRLDSDMYVIADVCMCQYTTHGHCGILSSNGEIDNDVTIDYLSRIALSYAKAGVDMVAPSDMMDGRVLGMRQALDDSGHVNLPIMSYSAKYASAFYGPFRNAAKSAPSFGNRKGYQMDVANGVEALSEVEADLIQGADIVMVKPAMMYLDIIRRIKDNFNVTIAAYHVSGEYAMLHQAINNGIISEEAALESMIALKRAGADLIITYYAKEIAKKL